MIWTGFNKSTIADKLIFCIFCEFAMIENLSSLSIEEKIGQLFFIGISGPELDEDTKDLLAEISPGGICLFARNIKAAAQTRDLLDGIRLVLSVEPMLSIDQEGGLVDRLRRLMTPMPAASKIKNAADATTLAAIIGEALRILGFNMNFAPVVDVVTGDRGKSSNGLFSRTFGDPPDQAATLPQTFLNALQRNGIVGCIKHFPGLGASGVDSHEELPSVAISETEFIDVDLVPYRELLQTDAVQAVMAAHACYPQHSLQEKDQRGKLLPSSLSYNFITKLLRGELGFDGLVITDDLEMGAIIKDYGIGDACVRAVTAGVDMLAICADPESIRQGYNAVLESVRSEAIDIARIDESLTRIAQVKSQLSPPAAFDPSRLETLSTEIALLNERSRS